MLKPRLVWFPHSIAGAPRSGNPTFPEDSNPPDERPSQYPQNTFLRTPAGPNPPQPPRLRPRCSGKGGPPRVEPARGPTHRAPAGCQSNGGQGNPPRPSQELGSTSLAFRAVQFKRLQKTFRRRRQEIPAAEILGAAEKLHEILVMEILDSLEGFSKVAGLFHAPVQKPAVARNAI